MMVEASDHAGRPKGWPESFMQGHIVGGKGDRTININLARVLRMVWQKKETTRIEIAQSLGLHKSTITNIINDIIAKGIVSEFATGSSGPQGGRKPIFLMLNKNYGCAAGFE